MAIRIDNYNDYETVILGRLAQQRDCTAADLRADARLLENIGRCWDAMIDYQHAAELLQDA